MLTILIALAKALPTVWNERFEKDSEAESALASWQEEREKLAAAVEISIKAAKARLEQEGKEDIWVEISDADLCCLISERPARVATSYRKALADAPDFAKGAVRDQLDIYRDLDLLTANIKEARTVPGLEGDGERAPEKKLRRVLLFTGHMIDAPGREKPRFPPDQEEVARQAIQKAVEAERDRPGGAGFRDRRGRQWRRHPLP